MLVSCACVCGYRQSVPGCRNMFKAFGTLRHIMRQSQPVMRLERFAKGLVELEYCFNPGLHLVLSHWLGPVALGGLLIGVPLLA